LRAVIAAGLFCSVAGEGISPTENCRFRALDKAALTQASFWSIIMAVPRKKTTPMKRGQRRSGHRKETVTYVENKKTGELHRPHHIDLKSGLYRGKQILPPKTEF
jgi:large subunit ribosomal protein L32